MLRRIEWCLCRLVSLNGKYPMNTGPCSLIEVVGVQIRAEWEADNCNNFLLCLSKPIRLWWGAWLALIDREGSYYNYLPLTPRVFLPPPQSAVQISISMHRMRRNGNAAIEWTAGGSDRGRHAWSEKQIIVWTFLLCLLISYCCFAETEKQRSYYYLPLTPRVSLPPPLPSAVHSMGKFVYAITAAEDIILSSLFIGRKQR